MLNRQMWRSQPHKKKQTNKQKTFEIETSWTIKKDHQQKLQTGQTEAIGKY